MPWWMKQRLMAEAGDDGSAGGTATGAANGSAGSGGASGNGQGGSGSGAGGQGVGPNAGASGGEGQGDGSADGSQGAGDGKSTPQTWPSDWREKYAGGDEKKLKVLSRYASPEAVFDAQLATWQRFSAGELKSALPKDATPEQVTAWRAENGIPESPDKYDLALDNGLTIGENDKPIIDGFLAKAHDANYTPAQAKQAVQWYFEHMQEAQAKIAEDTKRVEQQTEDALRAEWGQDFRPNMNAINGLLDSFVPAGDEELRTRILNGAKQNANFAKMLAGMALQVMREKRTEYTRAEKMQERYRMLLDARQRRAA